MMSRHGSGIFVGSHGDTDAGDKPCKPGRRPGWEAVPGRGPHASWRRSGGRFRMADDVPIYLDTRYSFAERAADLVSRLTLEEKVLQLHTHAAPAIGRL